MIGLVLNRRYQIIQILDFVHTNKVIHRDIKPSNIIRREADNKLVLIYFGAVKRITTEGQQRTIVIGTPAYIPIEQFNGKPNFCSDIYAVGMIGIQALTGIKPQPYVEGGFPHDSQENVFWQQSARVSSPPTQYCSDKQIGFIGMGMGSLGDREFGR